MHYNKYILLCALVVCGVTEYLNRNDSEGRNSWYQIFLLLSLRLCIRIVDQVDSSDVQRAKLLLRGGQRPPFLLRHHSVVLDRAPHVVLDALRVLTRVRVDAVAYGPHHEGDLPHRGGHDPMLPVLEVYSLFALERVEQPSFVAPQRLFVLFVNLEWNPRALLRQRVKSVVFLGEVHTEPVEDPQTDRRFLVDQRHQHVETVSVRVLDQFGQPLQRERGQVLRLRYSEGPQLDHFISTICFEVVFLLPGKMLRDYERALLLFLSALTGV